MKMSLFACCSALLAGAVMLLGNPAANADLLNEFQPNPTGSDPADVDFELTGTGNAAFDLWILSIESDSSSSTGLVDRATNVTGNYDANGIAVVSIPDLENPSFTTVLTSGFTGTVGTTDIDADNDGIVDDVSDLGAIMDALGIPDTTGEFLYGSQLGGQDFAHTGDEPKLVFRDGNSGNWWAINDPAGTDAFDINANPSAFALFNQNPENPTFGSTNPAFIPEPASGLLVVLGMAFGLLGTRRRIK